MSKTKQNNIVKAIMSSKGRFFGLYTKAGEALNAQFVSESPQYVTVYDRNSKDKRKLAKSSLYGFKLGSQKIGSC